MKSKKSHYNVLMIKELFQMMAFIRGLIFIKSYQERLSRQF